MNRKIVDTKWSLLLFTAMLLIGSEAYMVKSLEVVATAYNSLGAQTDWESPNQAAWGDFLKPGMKVIAVSRDLIPLGLDYKTPVEIDGFPGTFLVLDKMHRRKKKTIDIYMGHDVRAAKQWGRKKVTITWKVDRTVLPFKASQK
jgi:3D (Asp-Asp-Asp) domain-containing protein